jgi:hypothetical protein
VRQIHGEAVVVVGKQYAEHVVFQRSIQMKAACLPEALARRYEKKGKRIKWLILPLHESEADRHLIGLSG